VVGTFRDRGRLDRAFALTAQSRLTREDLWQKLTYAAPAVKDSRCVISPWLLDRISRRGLGTAPVFPADFEHHTCRSPQSMRIDSTGEIPNSNLLTQKT
jgi:hypothetical protein